jgi:hypothetical protein
MQECNPSGIDEPTEMKRGSETIRTSSPNPFIFVVMPFKTQFINFENHHIKFEPI